MRTLLRRTCASSASRSTPGECQGGEPEPRPRHGPNALRDPPPRSAQAHQGGRNASRETQPFTSVIKGPLDMTFAYKPPSRAPSPNVKFTLTLNKP